jgi:hypothetical protein
VRFAYLSRVAREEDRKEMVSNELEGEERRREGKTGGEKVKKKSEVGDKQTHLLIANKAITGK